MQNHRNTIRLRRLMEEHGLSGKEVADMTGRALKTVHCWRAGSPLPISDTMLELIELKVASRSRLNRTKRSRVRSKHHMTLCKSEAAQEDIALLADDVRKAMSAVQKFMDRRSQPLSNIGKKEIQQVGEALRDIFYMLEDDFGIACLRDNLVDSPAKSPCFTDSDQWFEKTSAWLSDRREAAK